LQSILDHQRRPDVRAIVARYLVDPPKVLYFAPPEWISYARHGVFTLESVLLCSKLDVTIRKLTKGQRSMNDFCKVFYSGSEGLPSHQPYTFEDVVSTLNQVAPYDWKQFLRQRLDSVEPTVRHSEG